MRAVEAILPRFEGGNVILVTIFPPAAVATFRSELLLVQRLRSLLAIAFHVPCKMPTMASIYLEPRVLKAPVEVHGPERPCRQKNRPVGHSDPAPVSLYLNHPRGVAYSASGASGSRPPKRVAGVLSPLRSICVGKVRGAGPGATHYGSPCPWSPLVLSHHAARRTTITRRQCRSNRGHALTGPSRTGSSSRRTRSTSSRTRSSSAGIP